MAFAEVGPGSSALRDELVYDAIDDEFVGGSPSLENRQVRGDAGRARVPSMNPHR